MTQVRLEEIKKQIEITKAAIQGLSELRPGTLVDFSVTKNKKDHGPYSMVVFSENGKKRSRQISPLYKSTIEKQIGDYKKLKSLVDNWIELGIEYSQLEMSLIKEENMTATDTINNKRRAELRKDSKYIHIMKYMGSKRALLPDILQHMKELAKNGGTVLDLFAGTCSVGSYLKHDYNVISNDIQQYSKTIANSLIASSNLKEKPELAVLLPKLLEFYNENLAALEEMFKKTLIKSQSFIDLSKDEWDETYREKYVEFVESFPAPTNEFKTKSRELSAVKKEYAKRNSGEKRLFPYMQTSFLFPETYFSIRQCMQIDSVRYAIDSVIDDEITKDIFLSALMYAHSYCSSGTGHFAMFRDIKTVKSAKDVFLYRNRDVWSYFVNKVEEILEYTDFSGITSHSSVSYDFEELLNNDSIMSGVNVVYADPPYSFVHYSRFYHATESLVRYDYYMPEFKGRYRTDRHQSPFCQSQNVDGAFQTLIERCAQTETSLLISYSDTGMIPLESILSMLESNGFSVKISEIDYDHSTMGRSGHKANKIKEYLISASVGKIQ